MPEPPSAARLPHDQAGSLARFVAPRLVPALCAVLWVALGLTARAIFASPANFFW